MFGRLIGIILPVFSVIGLGYFYGRRARPDMTWVNRINVNVLAPALIFSALASKDFDLASNGRAYVAYLFGVLDAVFAAAHEVEADAVRLVRKRGEYMQSAVPPGVFSANVLARFTRLSGCVVAVQPSRTSEKAT